MADAPALAPIDAARHEYALALAARRGNPDALEQLLVPCLSWAQHVARRLTTSQTDAEDLLQEGCLRAIQQLELFREGTRFGPWFVRLLYNLAFNRQRSARLRVTEPLDEQTWARGDTPLHDAIAAEIRDRFADAVASLPERQRVVVLMFEVEGFTTAEIAAELAITAETVRWHLLAARRALRDVLRPLHLADDETQENR